MLYVLFRAADLEVQFSSEEALLKATTKLLRAAERTWR
jgi:hypothetical protein